MKKYLFLITSFLTALVANGATYYVIPNGAGSKNGTSWANAFENVQTAIDKASSAGGGEVWIAKGTYKHGSAMTMKNKVAIYGGFAGTETSKDQRVEGNNTILDGEGSYRVFYNDYTEDSPLTNTAKLDNVTIQNGYISGYGAGMYNSCASPEITNCTFSGNCAYYGGGMYNSSSSSPTLTNCTFSGNSASSGGGMYNLSSSPTLTNCTFSNNSSKSSGGGIYNRESSSPTLTNCTFSGNSASYGGGMFNYNSSPTLTNCTFRGNSAYNGGGMYNGSSSPVLTNCTFSNNSAEGDGGGMYNESSSPVLTNCTFSNNSASRDGGGMYNYSSSPVLTNCILWGNTASNSGNEIYNYDSYRKSTIDTCIIKGGKSGIYNSDYCTFTTEPITADPLLQTLADNGGAVQTIAVAEGSSAIGAGKVVEGVTTDARGVARSTTAPTIGAYEYVAPPTITAQPTALEVYQGSVGNLSVSTSGDNLTYQWYFNGEAIEGATSATLEFSNIQKDAQGSYYCEISNSVGTIKTDAVNVSVLIKVFYVVEGGAGNKDGSSWANAFADVQTAIDKASSVATAESPSEVWIAKGTYKHGSAMTMKNDVAIYGGFAGTETSKDQRVEGNNTILDGEGSYRVFYNDYTEDSPLTNTAKLDNVTIQNGFPSDENYDYSTTHRGAGMYNSFASPEITNCTFFDNDAVSADFSSGGGMCNYYSNPTLINCTFAKNDACEDGGGMCNYYSSPTLTNCTFTDNSSPYGSGMCNWSSSPTLTNCTFTDHYAMIGGGMENIGSNPTLTNCTFTNNLAIESGGGMYNSSSSPTLTNCTFSGNSSTSDYYGGGGMYNSSSSPVLTNCILWGNTASSGNEIYNDDSNCKPTIDTCIIKGGKSGIYDYYNSSTYKGSFITADPKLMPLGNYGGSVQTCPVGAGSSAIGAGKVVEGVTIDARGVVRSTTAPTIGAYEYVKVQTAFESWAENTGLTGDNAKPTAIPHNDGITNLEKFTYGLDASKATSYDANANIKHSTDVSGNASLQFPVNVDAEGVVQVKALKSTDLINWVEATATATGETSSDGKFKIYKATAPVGEDGKVFLKLKVEEK